MQDTTANDTPDVDAVLSLCAPTAADALRTLTAAAGASGALDGDGELTALLARVCAVQHGLTPLAPPGQQSVPAPIEVDPADWRARSDLDESVRVYLAFAERFVIDVTTVDDTARTTLGQALGAATGDFVFQLYVLDMVPRVRSALAQLFRVPDRAGTDDPEGSHAEPALLWPSIDEFIRVVARLDTLDPVTAELVRLRGARQHHCRMCQSLRNRSAMLAGADDEMFEAVDHYVDGGLSPRHTAALALVDAMIWTPAHLGDEVLSSVRREFSAAEQVELVLDVMRNAANKIAVALAADGANIDEGYEIYDIGADGDPVYGLTLA